MDHILKAIILGLVQGLSEFLPISSSGHLVIMGDILNFNGTNDIAFEVFLHFGTLCSVLIALRREVFNLLYAPYAVWLKKSECAELKEFLRWDLYIILASVPAALVGLIFKEQIENIFSNVLLTYFMLLCTAAMMISTRFISCGQKEFKMGNTFLIGIAQAFAILPGISRSGSTIFTGMLLKMDREKVARFSFLMSLPVIFGATLLKFKDLVDTPPADAEIGGLIAGTVMAFVSGYFAIIWLLDIVKKGKLQIFGYYCLVIAISGIIWKLFA
ncbi:MAG: undecaprenyl-diphosphate phosphatase [Gammaproteobacteria bacterium]|nr:undecaprenyl-diphosphate phosphatase [Gammaproteobacteria bacterium]